MRNPMSVALGFFALALSACGDRDLAAGSLLVGEGSVQQAIHSVCPAGQTTYGIDVSYYQGNIDWAAVAGAGVEFAIIRVSDGIGFHDPKFAQNWAGAKANGIIRGTYQFFRSDDDPIAQADLLIETMGALDPGDLPPVVDVESTDGVDNATRAARLQVWLDRVEAAVGAAPIIYTGGYFWQDNVGRDFSRYPLWHAGYTGGTCPSTVANQWSDWAFWQFGSTGRVAGISGNVDENRFNGSLQQLRDFAGTNRQPRGTLDAATCDGGVLGWAQDEDTADAAIDVHVYFDAQLFVGTAATHRDDLCTAIGSCAHGFSMPIPNLMRDDVDHTVVVWGIDDAGDHAVLSGSNMTVRCPPPALPADVLVTGVLRLIETPAVMQAWGFDFSNVSSYSDDVIATLPPGEVWAAAPRTVRADGEVAVYIVDAGTRRPVQSAESFSAWGFDADAIEVLSAADLEAIPLATPLRLAPVLVRGTGVAVYVLDVKISVDSPDSPDSPDVVDDDPEVGASQRFIYVDDGCAATPVPVPAAALVLALLGRRRRRH